MKLLHLRTLRRSSDPLCRLSDDAVLICLFDFLPSIPSRTILLQYTFCLYDLTSRLLYSTETPLPLSLWPLSHLQLTIGFSTDVVLILLFILGNLPSKNKPVLPLSVTVTLSTCPTSIPTYLIYVISTLRFSTANIYDKATRTHFTSLRSLRKCFSSVFPSFRIAIILAH
jgi:hypothetical protein